MLLDCEELLPSDSCYAQLRLEERAVAFRGDRFVIRSYSPMETIGGGVVLEANPPKRKRFNSQVIDELRLKETGSPVAVAEKVLELNSSSFPTTLQLARLLGKAGQELEKLISDMKARGTIVEFPVAGDRVFAHIRYIDKLMLDAQQMLEAFHSRYPIRSGIPVEEFRRRLFGSIRGTFIEQILANMQQQRYIKILNNVVSLFDFSVEFNQEQKKVCDRIVNILEQNPYSTPDVDSLLQQAGNSTMQTREVLEALIEQGKVKRLKDDIIILADYYQKAVEMAVQAITQNGKLNLSDFRDMLGTSRKYAVALLEEMDKDKITRWMDDHRVLYKQ
jgi:selenocysteine-specific elongation factor